MSRSAPASSGVAVLSPRSCDMAVYTVEGGEGSRPRGAAAAESAESQGRSPTLFGVEYRKRGARILSKASSPRMDERTTENE